MATVMKLIGMITVSIILIIVPLVATDQYQPILHPNGWYWPTISGSTNTEPETGYDGWLERYNVLVNGVRIPAIHVGKDFEGITGEPVFAVANGEIVKQDAYLTAYGPNGGPGGALIAQFKTSDGTVFRAVYGHINNPHEVGPVYAGEVIGYINNYDPSHLHFGIHLGDEAPVDGKDYRGFIRADEYTGSTYGWVNPIEFLATNEPPASVVGEWTLNYDWGCTGNLNQAMLTFYSDGALSYHGELENGDPETGTTKWVQNGEAVSWDWSERGATYDGTIDLGNMEGEMLNDEGETGCWSAFRRYTAPGMMA